MTDDDFQRFLSLAKAAFPPVDQHFRKMPGEQQGDALILWRRALSDVDPRLARAALDQMISGDLERPEFGWSDFPKLIRQGAGSIEAIEQAQRREEHDARDARRCPICRDSPIGEVRVWNPWMVGAVGEKILHCHHMGEVRDIWRRWHRAEIERRSGGLHLGAICSCEGFQSQRKRGLLEEYQALRHEDRSAWRRKHNLPGVVGVYDAKWFCVWAEQENAGARLAMFVAWHETQREPMVAKYKEFAEWAK